MTGAPLNEVDELAVEPMPPPGRLVSLAYRELTVAANGSDEQKRALGPASALPRPWDPSTCHLQDLQGDLLDWLHRFVSWLNREHTWDYDAMIPDCWPHHPHLVREIALLADQRRRAGLALSSDQLEDWHRYGLPAFVERMRGRLRSHCAEGHQPWPGRARHCRPLTSDESAGPGSLDRGRLPTPPSESYRLARIGLVDLDTGELRD